MESRFDVASTCASEVRNPGHSYPQALIISFLLLVAVYGLPALIGISVIPNPTKWITGTYINVAKTIGGRFLGVRYLTFDSNQKLQSHDLLNVQFVLYKISK